MFGVTNYQTKQPKHDRCGFVFSRPLKIKKTIITMRYLSHTICASSVPILIGFVFAAPRGTHATAEIIARAKDAADISNYKQLNMHK